MATDRGIYLSRDPDPETVKALVIKEANALKVLS
jgi:hypothetical protein